LTSLLVIAVSNTAYAFAGYAALPRRAFVSLHTNTNINTPHQKTACRVTFPPLAMATPASPNENSDKPKLEMIPEGQEGIPIPFVDTEKNNFIECFADSVCTIDGVSYTIGCPCDYAVALCYFDDKEQLFPVELDDESMDDVFPVAENIVEEEFGDELSLQRTPQTLTLVGELEDDDDDDDEDEDDDMEDGEEEVEVLLSFEHRGKEYNLVRLLDPVLLVAKNDPKNPTRMVLLTPAESDIVMPTLEGMFLEYSQERDIRERDNE